MPPQPYLLGIDQGTSGSRALLLDRAGQVRGYGYCPLPRLYPRPDWVEQEPGTVVEGVATAITQAIAAAGCRPAEIAACGIACQRNTDFVWDARTGQPLTNAITWQDLRTGPMLAELAARVAPAEQRRRLGYFPGPYSSALHLAWRMEHEPAVAGAAGDGTLRLGFSGNWLLTALGKPAGYWMDFSLVQQMGLFDFRTERYWADWLDILKIPADILPAVVPTLHDFGALRITGPDGATADVPVLAMIGNEQAALFGHGCFHPGEAECSHGTASFVDVIAGHTAPEQEKLNVYYAWTLPDQLQPSSKVQSKTPAPLALPARASVRAGARVTNQKSKIVHTYCLEADTTVSGAAIRWMKEQARLFDRDEEVGPLAASVPDSAGVVFVPAFTGLNVPYNDPTARGAIFGLTLGSSRGHIVRAFLESLGYQVRAILETIFAETGLQVDQLSMGGGIARSDEACQIQADLVGIPIIRPAFTETAARAAALLAGLGAEFWPTLADLPSLPGEATTFEPTISADRRDAGYAQWQRAVEKARGWDEVNQQY